MSHQSFGHHRTLLSQINGVESLRIPSLRDILQQSKKRSMNRGFFVENQLSTSLKPRFQKIDLTFSKAKTGSVIQNSSAIQKSSAIQNSSVIQNSSAIQNSLATQNWLSNIE